MALLAIFLAESVAFLSEICVCAFNSFTLQKPSSRFPFPMTEHCYEPAGREFYQGIVSVNSGTMLIHLLGYVGCREGTVTELQVQHEPVKHT